MMKRLVLLLTLAVAGGALADAKFIAAACSKDKTQNTASACTQTANSASGNEPTAATPGVDLVNVCSLRVVVSAASGQTLSGAGTLKFWLYSQSLGRYVVNRVVTRSVTTSGERDHLIDDLWVGVHSGKVYVEAESVTVSSGAVSVYVETIGCKP